MLKIGSVIATANPVLHTANVQNIETRFDDVSLHMQEKKNKQIAQKSQPSIIVQRLALLIPVADSAAAVENVEIQYFVVLGSIFDFEGLREVLPVVD